MQASLTKITNYTKFLSRRSKLRKPSPIRALQPLVSLPGMISLGGGMPNPSLFPIADMTITLTSGIQTTLPKTLLQTALQYSPSPGLPALVQLLKEDTSEAHSVPLSSDWSTLISTGSQDAIAKMLDCLLDDGDTLLLENPTYPGTLSALRSMGIKMFGTDVDEYGMNTSKLRHTLDNWSELDQTKDFVKPRVIYVIPTGQNPSGATLSNFRRKELYKIAQEHDLLILEDDPYWHLQLGPIPKKSTVSSVDNDSSPLQSLFSMDVDGRVIRFDSLSKVVSSGLRIGYATGPTPLIYQLELSQQSSCLHTSGISQALVYHLITTLGPEGWEKHVKNVQDFYTQRRDTFINLCEKHLTGLAEWHPPVAGMFLWIKLLGITDSSQLVKNKFAEAKVLAIPGESCITDPSIPSPYIRCSFSTASDEEMDEALKRLAAILKESRQDL